MQQRPAACRHVPRDERRAVGAVRAGAAKIADGGRYSQWLGQPPPGAAPIAPTADGVGRHGTPPARSYRACGAASTDISTDAAVDAAASAGPAAAAATQSPAYPAASCAATAVRIRDRRCCCSYSCARHRHPGCAAGRGVAAWGPGFPSRAVDVRVRGINGHGHAPYRSGARVRRLCCSVWRRGRARHRLGCSAAWRRRQQRRCNQRQRFRRAAQRQPRGAAGPCRGSYTHAAATRLSSLPWPAVEDGRARDDDWSCATAACRHSR